MSQLGIGTMLGMLTDNSVSVALYHASMGKIITEMKLDESTNPQSFIIKFEDGSSIKLTDEGQSCCEQRYMSIDGDDLSYFAGATLTGIDLKDAPNQEEEYEVQFLEIQTSKGVATVSSHNEHNGYYGGFCIRISKGE